MPVPHAVRVFIVYCHNSVMPIDGSSYEKRYEPANCPRYFLFLYFVKWNDLWIPDFICSQVFYLDISSILRPTKRSPVHTLLPFSLINVTVLCSERSWLKFCLLDLLHTCLHRFSVNLSLISDIHQHTQEAGNNFGHCHVVTTATAHN